MRRIIMVMAAAGLCLATAAGAQTAATPSAQEIIRARQASFHLSAATMGGLGRVAQEQGSPRQAAFAAAGLAKWAKALPTMFPAGTGPEAGVATRAKPDIWSDRADFEAKAAAYAAATQRLAELAAADDAAGFAAQFQAVRQTCQSCHDKYQAK